ncbi:hypothetical protein GCM10025867_49250 (plasmid) [Frondihabitans sucicola]|uniref:Uncharacterized protein n=1 Tax=Frondihabitans sucicola TaxID=1268041 RepID=A0ABN6Y5U9_9MICO|nr:hypothetical protein [Frondihabitans sucicola]BDZ52684.1 hypothetical protein GCM10025867_49250 [Frondihabitans sucicola]
MTPSAVIERATAARSEAADMHAEKDHQYGIAMAAAVRDGYHFSTVPGPRDRQGEKALACISINHRDFIADVLVDGATNVTLTFNFASVKGFPASAPDAHDLLAHVEQEIVTYAYAAALATEIADRYGVSPGLLLPL